MKVSNGHLLSFSNHRLHSLRCEFSVPPYTPRTQRELFRNQSCPRYPPFIPPLPPQRARQKIERKRCRRQEQILCGRDGDRPWLRRQIHATNLLQETERLSILIHGPCSRKLQTSQEAKGSPPKTALSGRGTSPPYRLNRGWRGRSPKPADPDEEYTAIIHGGEVSRSTAVMFRDSLWQAGQ